MCHSDSTQAVPSAQDGPKPQPCDCGRGYFCREHGDWISGPEVGSGIAPSREDQKHGFCPANHYEDPSGRESYVGQRDGLAF
ncbi:unnamed protein product [Clonostachys rhizophaga]|uniref:Uncharacterized protein n=1 Tax=Clonostachys rhizophaga TaxID=160324 RepID=A0A9N9YFQ3_9HYPO|nr:unnamed protein product [Clonostachys rhizophaga]